MIGHPTLKAYPNRPNPSGVATGTAAFEIGPNVAIDSDGNQVESVRSGDSQGSPAVGPLAGLVLLGVAFLVRRR